MNGMLGIRTGWMLALALIGGLAALAISTVQGGRKAEVSPWPEVVVYKSASCGCCRSWVAYLRQRGFQVAVRNTSDIKAIKDRLGIPVGIRSCHTAKIGDLVVEGHVTVPTLVRALRDTSVAAIAVPGMPFGSPGMGGWVQPFEEVALTTSGKLSAYHRVTGPEQL
jgi:hypothetical protein